MFENEALKEKLEYMYPGEIILNMSQGEIAEMLLRVANRLVYTKKAG